MAAGAALRWDDGWNGLGESGKDSGRAVAAIGAECLGWLRWSAGHGSLREGPKRGAAASRGLDGPSCLFSSHMHHPARGREGSARKERMEDGWDPDMASRLLIPPDPKLGARPRALEQRSWRGREGGGGRPYENININPGAYALLAACC